VRLHIVLRTPQQKADLEGSWRRTDEDFFASGACHVLAAAFLEAHPALACHALMLQPTSGLRGGHVLIESENHVFDCRGWNERAAYLGAYSAEMQRLCPGWSCDVVRIADPIGWEFCRAHSHRHPSQFWQDPLPRARSFLARFAPAPGT
jgi:hypothetical protein